MKSFKKTLKIVGNVILWLFVAFAVLITVLVFSSQRDKDGLSNLAGRSIVTIVSNSMSPTFKTGDLIFDKILTDEQKANCAVGDVITFYSDINNDGNDEINTHRIVEVEKRDGKVYYTTKGDNKKTNFANDKDAVPSDKVLGKYTGKKLTSAGKAIDFLRTSTGFLCVIVIPLVLFFLFELYNFIAVVIKTKAKGKISAGEEEEIKRRAVEEYLKEQQQNSAAAETAVTAGTANKED